MATALTAIPSTARVRARGTAVRVVTTPGNSSGVGLNNSPRPVTDDDNELGWNDPTVVIGAVALVGVIVWIVISLVIGHNPFHANGHPSPPSKSRSVVPSSSEVPTSPPSPAELPYRNCAAAARDGRWNIHIGDPAFNPALDRNHDGIACER